MIEYHAKITKSFFDGKITIPNDYISIFVDENEFNTKNSKEIYILFKKKLYNGKFHFVHQSRGSRVLQISFGSDLLVLLKQEFIQTYFAIQSQKLLKNDNKKFQTNLLGGNQEVVTFKAIDESTVELTPFIKIETPYDGIFKELVNNNVFGWISIEKDRQMITKYSGWKDISQLNKYADTPYVIYYLIDEADKKLYIGSAKRLGDRVVPGRREIPKWNRFMFEMVHPDFHHCLKEVEYHSIMAFSKFLHNNGNKSTLGISDYTLVNKDYKYYRD